MAITALPPNPSRTEANAVFAAKADALMAALGLFVTQTNAAVDAMNFNSVNSTSSTSMAIGNGNKTFTVEASKSYVPGQTLKIAYTTDPTQWMLGDCISYNSSTGQLVVNVQYTQGTGTFAAWTISLGNPAPVTIPSGSSMLFYQAAAPTGWTTDTNPALNHALRVVPGGGIWGGKPFTGINFDAAFTSQPVTGSNSATTLTSAQIPSHTHAYSDVDNAGTPAAGGSYVGSIGNLVTKTSGATGGGTSHNHTFTGTSINLTVSYLNVIRGIKD